MRIRYIAKCHINTVDWIVNLSSHIPIINFVNIQYVFSYIFSVYFFIQNVWLASWFISGRSEVGLTINSGWFSWQSFLWSNGTVKIGKADESEMWSCWDKRVGIVFRQVGLLKRCRRQHKWPSSVCRFWQISPLISFQRAIVSRRFCSGRNYDFTSTALAVSGRTIC